MVEVKIKNQQGQQTHGSTFETLEQAQAWIDQVKPTGAWGKPGYTEVIPAVKEWQEVVVQPEERDEDGNIIQEEIKELREIVIQEEQIIEHSDEFTIEIEDISAQVQAERKLAIRKQKRAFGEHLIDKIAMINESANVDRQTLEALILDQDFMVIKEFLWDGSLKSAYEKILSIEPKILTVFSQQALDQIKGELLNKLQELGEINI